METKRQRDLLLLGSILLIVAILAVFVGATFGQEVAGPDDIKYLLEELNQRALSEGLIYTIVVEPPLSNEDQLSIGYGYDDISTSMYSISADHFCTRRIAGSAERIHCIPYTSIAHIFYTNN